MRWTTSSRHLRKLFAHYDANKIIDALKDMSLLKAESPPPPDAPEAMFAQWMGQWEAALSSERQGLADSAEARALLAIDNMPAGDKLTDLVLLYQEALRQVSSAEARSRASIRAYAKLPFQGQSSQKRRSSESMGRQSRQKRSRAAAEKLCDNRIESALKAVGEMPDDLDRLTARLLPLWHGLLEQTRQVLPRHRKRAAAQVDFDDLERLTADLLRHEEPRQRYRNAEIKHVLVDEFQDTNAAQWQIIRSLVDTIDWRNLLCRWRPQTKHLPVPRRRCQRLQPRSRTIFRAGSEP